MNIINATTHANTQLVWELEWRRASKAGTAVVKRRIRRQVRQHLAVELRGEVHQLHVDAVANAAELAAARRSVDRMVGNIAKELDRPVKVSKANGKTVALAYEVPMPKPERKVLVTRKLAGSPFERKQIDVVTLTV